MSAATQGQSVKSVQLSGWVRQLQKQLRQFNNTLNEGTELPSIEEQIIFVQQQYELLSMLYEVSLGMDSLDSNQKIVGVDVDLITQEAARRTDPL